MRLNLFNNHVNINCLVAAVSLMIFNLCGTHALGQTTTARIRGTVQDEAGAVIPGAAVSATNKNTGLSRSAVTDGNGAYSIAELPVGTYTLTVEKEGFKRINLTGITLQVDQVVQLDPKLSVGSINENVVIDSEAPLVNTTSPAIGELIDNKQIVKLPLNGRQFLQLAQLSPGVTISPNGSLGQQLGGINGPRITSNGGREDQNYFTLDGVSVTDPFYNTLDISPSVDAIQEFKVEQSLYSTASGFYGGAQINIVTNSGTNQLHGTAYEFLRNDRLDARNFFDLKKPPFRQNQYGLSIGGPIAKNRTFFFGNFEELRIRKGITSGASVPTEVQRLGNLSSFGGPITDPLTGNPFPGNIIPSNRIDPSSAEILAFIPPPNSNDPTRNLISAPSLKNDTNQFLVRIDHQFSNQNSIYGRFAYSNTKEFEPFGPLSQLASGGGAGRLPGFGVNLTSKARNLALHWTRVFTPTLVGDFKFGYNRISGGQVQQNSGNNFGQRNNIANVAQTGVLSGFPLFQTSIFSDFGDANLLLRRTYELYQYGGDISWTRGNHAIKFGGEGQHVKFDPIVDLIDRGQFLYFGTFTGNSFADFLLGLPGFSLSGVGDASGRFRGNPAAFYFQDDWHVSPRLTLNLGLRWDYFGSFSESRLHQATFIPETKTFVLASDNGRVNTNEQLPGAQQFLEQFFPFITSEKAGLPRALYRRDLNNFAPRVGFAFDVFGNQKTVLRSGYGVFFNAVTLNLLAANTFGPPFFALGQVPSFLFPPNQANIHVTLLSIQPGAQVFFNPRNPDWRDGYIQQWNLSLQQSITSSFIIEARYVGSKGTKLLLNDYSFNNAPPGDPATVSSRLPFPQFGPTTRQNSIGNSSYNALQLRAEQRLQHGLSFAANYTFGKSIDEDSLAQSLENGNLQQDPTNRRLEHARSAYDVKHNFVANFNYDLPFSANGKWKPVVSGWTLLGILSLQTGRPFHVNISGDRAGTGNTITQRPDVLGDPNLPSSQRTPERWFNVDAFLLQPIGKVGTAGRSQLEGPSFKTFDFSVIKETPINERFHVQFRAEFFNVFNFVNFNFPNQVFVPAGGILGPAGSKNANPSFGKIFTAKDSRVIQFGLKLVF